MINQAMIFVYIYCISIVLWNSFSFDQLYAKSSNTLFLIFNIFVQNKFFCINSLNDKTKPVDQSDCHLCWQYITIRVQCLNLTRHSLHAFVYDFLLLAYYIMIFFVVQIVGDLFDVYLSTRVFF